MLFNERQYGFLEELEKYEFEMVLLLEVQSSRRGYINLALGYIENDKNKKNYFILYKLNGSDEKKINILVEDGLYIEELITNAKISIMPEGICGLDGCSYTLLFNRNSNFAQYHWWSKPDKDWSTLGEIVEIIFKYLPSEIITSNCK